MSQANKDIKNRGFAPIVSRETLVILLFSDIIENKSITFRGAKIITYNFGGCQALSKNLFFVCVCKTTDFLV
jgi:hypothetical protein